MTVIRALYLMILGVLVHVPMAISGQHSHRPLNVEFERLFTLSGSSQTEAGQMLGVTREHVNQAINGTGGVSLPLIKLFKILMDDRQPVPGLEGNGLTALGDELPVPAVDWEFLYLARWQLQRPEVEQTPLAGDAEIKRQTLKAEFLRLFELARKSQIEIGEMLGVTRNHVNLILNQESAAPSLTVIKLFKIWVGDTNPVPGLAPARSASCERLLQSGLDVFRSDYRLGTSRVPRQD